ncbi:hypothetical protein Bca4012_002022 [Brassica carinata]
MTKTSQLFYLLHRFPKSKVLSIFLHSSSFIVKRLIIGAIITIVLGRRIPRQCQCGSLTIMLTSKTKGIQREDYTDVELSLVHAVCLSGKMKHKWKNLVSWLKN